MIYLASPYSHPVRLVEQQRYSDVALATAKLIERGHFIYSPVVHNHYLSHLIDGNPTAYTPWKDYDENFIECSDEMWILMLDGWGQSEGIQQEVAFAKTLELPLKAVYLPRYSVKEISYKEIEYLIAACPPQERS